MRPSSLYDIMQTATVVMEAKEPPAIEYIHMDDSSALVPGGALVLRSREGVGLMLQYVAVGLLYGVIPSLVYPVFNLYLGLTGYEVIAYSVLVSFGWLLKILFGILSDCAPIYGYRRKPWLLLGWAMAVAGLAYMTIADFGAPFCRARPRTEAACNYTELSSLSPAVRDSLYNMETRANGHHFVVASTFVGLGYAIVSSAADAMMVHYAQREPLASRGHVATILYTARAGAAIVGHIYVCIFTNSAGVGSGFDFEVPPNVGYGLLLLPSLVALVAVVRFVVEPRMEAVRVSTWLAQLYALLQHQVLWQVCAFRFLHNVFASFHSAALLPLAEQWGGVTPLDASIMDSVGLLLIALVFLGVARTGLLASWRWLIGGSTGIIVAAEAVLVLVTIWDVRRSPYVVLWVPVADQVVAAIRFLVAIFCAIEIAERGNEGTVFGLVTNVHNWATPFGTLLFSAVDKALGVSDSMWLSDTTADRWHVTTSMLVSLGAQLAALGWLVLLPPQKIEMQYLKNEGGKSRAAARALLGASLLGLTFAVVTTSLTLTPDAACFRLANGHC
ncbi:folate-Biopterin Transporter (FBT) family [Achlya hypogyna]|uniref:Folate-Biopterin Transporter (FBT) family n=1 Tax=Achlya hypogyna TaxID=1202772 RepID=A0A1V9YAX8_ACHHY|nr:folate-Biopterin Transporter (FBT) family [Achlya hypogyna]